MLDFSELHITLITILVILMALASDIVGALDIIGPLFMGLVLPSGPPLGTALIGRIDLVTTELLLPISFIIAGREMDWAAAGQELKHGLWVALLMLVSNITKVVSAAFAASYCNFSFKKGALLGLIMNFKGIMEIILLIDYRLGRVCIATLLLLIL
jgi:Kef-type K+ transport system membrane component KefB